MNKILFRLNAGNVYGLGHLSRNLVIIKSLLKKSIDVSILIKTDNEQFISYFLQQNDISVPVEYLPVDFDILNDLKKIINTYKDGKYAFLVIDHYDHNFEYQKYLFQNSVRWAQFDNGNELTLIPNIVINPNISFDKEFYIDRIQAYTKLCVGTEFAIIRNIPSKLLNIYKEEKSILLSLGGGSIPSDLINVMIQLIVRSKYNFYFITTDYKIRDIFKNYNNVDVIFNKFDLSEIYQKSSYAIVAGGVTSYECAYFKIPMLIIPFVPNQKNNAFAWDKNNCSISFSSVADFKDSVKTFGLDFLIKKLSMKFDNNKVHIDGFGTERIVKEILNVME